MTGSQQLKTIALDDTICKPGSVKWICLTNADTTGLPNAYCAYSMARVAKRVAQRVILTLFMEDKIYECYYGGSSWTNWKEYSTEPSSLDVNTTTDSNGNAVTGLTGAYKYAVFCTASGSYASGYFTPFRAANGGWYIHCSKWDGTAATGQTVKGTFYYHT